MPASPALIGIRYDRASSFQRGPADAPPLIRQALHTEASNGWSEALVDLRAPGILQDRGDVLFAENAAVREDIEASVSHLLGEGLLPLVLGGDHSITYPVVRAVAARHPGLNILHLDAHPDLYDSFEGDRYSHACPFARIMEDGLARRLVQVGIRTLNGHQKAQAERFGVEIIDMRSWRDDLTLAFEGPVYLSLDVDVLDPAFAPGVSHREPGGLSVRQVINLIQRFQGRLVGADVVEYNPRNDPLHLTAAVCAKLLKEIATRMITQGDPR